MAERITLTATDNHQLDAWRADPGGPAKGGMIILQAIFGMTPHLGKVCDMYAADGYAAIAPALYDREGKNLVFGYDKDGMAAGIAQREHLREDTVLADIKACETALRPSGKVAVSGFCTGGTWAWITAARGDVDAAVIFYGSNVHDYRDLTPGCPTLLHYGDRDIVVPIDEVEDIRAAYPDLPLHIYEGQGHAFFNPDQAGYDAEAAGLAFARTLEFLGLHLAGPDGA